MFLVGLHRALFSALSYSTVVISDLKQTIKSFLMKFAYDTKSEEIINNDEDKLVIQNDLQY